MSGKCFFWHGIKVLGTLQDWKPYAIPQSPIEKQGTSRLHGALNVRSRNYLYEIMTATTLEPQTTLVIGNSLDIGPQGVMNLKFLAWQKTMVQHSKNLGPLSWCESDAEVCQLSGVVVPGSFPGVVTAVFVVAADGYTPVVGMDVLLRDPDSGDGLVGRITAVATPNVTIDVQQTAPTGVVPDDDWEMTLIRFYFPDTAFVSVDGYETTNQVDDKWIERLTTRFKSMSDPVMADSYVLDLG